MKKCKPRWQNSGALPPIPSKDGLWIHAELVERFCTFCRGFQHRLSCDGEWMPGTHPARAEVKKTNKDLEGK